PLRSALTGASSKVKLTTGVEPPSVRASIGKWRMTRLPTLSSRLYSMPLTHKALARRVAKVRPEAQPRRHQQRQNERRCRASQARAHRPLRRTWSGRHGGRRDDANIGGVDALALSDLLGPRQEGF